MKKNTKKTKLSVGKDFVSEERMIVERQTAMGQVAVPDSIYEVWGMQKKSNFPATTEDGYREYLQKLNKADLQQECFKHDKVYPRDSREAMEKQLMKAFRRHKALETQGALPRKVIVETDELKRLLSPGANS